MRTEKDFEELLRLFNKNKVHYLIVGAYAVAFYSTPRYTKDMDIVIEPTDENAAKTIKALAQFGFKSLNLKNRDFNREGKIVQLGYEPLRIDLITSIEGIEFKKAWKNRTVGTYGKQKVYFIGRDELIKNKKSSNRKQDKVDVDILTQRRKT